MGVRPHDAAFSLRHYDHGAAPALPTGPFDLVFAGSVFTHIVDLAGAWPLELRRILKPGRRAYLTFNDEFTIARILEK